MTPASKTPGRASTPQLLIIALILIIVAILTIHRLGSGPCGESAPEDTGWFRSQLCGADVCGTNEAIEGVFVEQMVERGRILFPVENGRQPMYKPPLFHWTALAIDRVFGIGRVTAFNLRLPSAAYAVAAAALTIAFVATRFDPATGIIAGLVLAGSYQYIGQGRDGRVDMALTFCEALALFAFLWWLPAKSRPPGKSYGDARETALRYLFAIALGLGVLAKGPVGAILPGAAILIFLLVERRFVAVIKSFIPGPAIVAILIGASWYLACYAGGRYGFLNRQLASENFGRFFGGLGVMPPWYYLKPLFLNSAPLSLISPIAVIVALWVRR
ncbi:MAG: ArnT family glycosyltransferase, partial [Candidatus Binataceae bacterium]